MTLATAPVQTGWIDTYPGSDARGYDGAWSNYPYFKDGKVIIRDIDRGFFLVDVTAATTRTILTNNLTVLRGSVLSGSLEDLHTANSSMLGPPSSHSVIFPTLIHCFFVSPFLV